jgi:aspartate/glutamate racemase
LAKLAILHTTLATTVSLPALAAEILPGVTLHHFVDDTILIQLLRNGGELSEVEERVIQYARFAEGAGVDALLCACSSIGEIMPVAQQSIRIPCLRIDEPMAQIAVEHAVSIGVAATLSTTLGPTSRLIAQKAKEAGKAIVISEKLIDGAYELLIRGDAAGHDELLLEGLADLAERTELVVLAQASMARVLTKLPVSEAARCMSSPRLGLENARKIMENLQA